MSQRDIDFDWTLASNGASFGWMGKGTREGRTTGISGDLKSRLSLEISRIASLGKDDLRAAWSTEFRKLPPAALTRDMLVRTLAWRLQEKAFGGYDQATVKMLEAYARAKGGDALFHKLKSGTVLVREYRGTRHTVIIVGDGYMWQERTYPNLSAIARAITGTNWNGPRFFGLRQAGRCSARKASGELHPAAGKAGPVADYATAGANG